MDNNIINFLREKGVNVVYGEQDEIQSKLQIWEQFYKGFVDKFHEYYVYNGTEKKKKARATLNMPATVAQRWADLLLNEKVEITAPDEKTQKRLDALLEQTNFLVRGNNLIELAFALGGGFFVQYWTGKKTKQKYISQKYAYPISFDSGELTECAFASYKNISGKRYVYLETHTLDESGLYVIDNFLLSPNGKDGLKEVSNDFYKAHNIRRKWETKSETPLFQQIRPNITNRDDFNSPFGTSVYSSATDVFKTIDIIYDSYKKEFLLGKKRLFVQDGAAHLNYDAKTGNMVNVFDPEDEAFYRIPEADEGKPIEEINGTLRVAEHDTALQTNLNILSQKVGLGAKAFKWENGNVTTATQVVSENSEMFRTLKKHENLLRDAIVGMCRGLLFVESSYTGENLNFNGDFTVNFDDSIIEDSAEQKRQAMLEYNSGLIDEIQYYVDVYKMSEEQALEYREKLKKRSDISEEPEPEDEY